MSYCNAGDTDCQLIYNLYRNINSNLEDQNINLELELDKFLASDNEIREKL